MKVKHINWGQGAPPVHSCPACFPSVVILDYVYGIWWKCRHCGAWESRW
jgi:ribosomal protein L37AE/L43A